MHDHDLTEVGDPRLELEIPRLYRLLQAELVALDLRERCEHFATAEEDLALVPDTRTYEEVLGDIYQLLIGDVGAL